MIKDPHVIRVQVEDREYEFHCEKTSLLGETHDVLQSMKMHIIELMKKVDEPKEEQEKCCKGESCE